VLRHHRPYAPGQPADHPADTGLQPHRRAGVPSIRVGESVTLAATVSGGTALLTRTPVIAWFSSNGDVATVSSTGLVQGLRAGTTLVWAIYQGTRAAAHVRVFGPGKKADQGPHACLMRRPVPSSNPNLISC
jgi:hypothetical protein